MFKIKYLCRSSKWGVRSTCGRKVVSNRRIISSAKTTPHRKRKRDRKVRKQQQVYTDNAHTQAVYLFILSDVMVETCYVILMLYIKCTF